MSGRSVAADLTGGSRTAIAHEQCAAAQRKLVRVGQIHQLRKSFMARLLVTAKTAIKGGPEFLFKNGVSGLHATNSLAMPADPSTASTVCCQVA